MTERTEPDRGGAVAHPEPGSQVCYRHPKRETGVTCSRCDRPICPECMREASVGHQCPECVADGRRTVRKARTAFGGTQWGRLGYVTNSLIVLNVLAMVAAMGSAWLDSGAAGAARSLAGSGFLRLWGDLTPLHEWGSVLGYARYATDPQQIPHGIAAGEYYRLLTGMFLHYGVVHLVLNMSTLLLFGRYLEERLGPVRFLALYLLAGIGGNVIVFALEAPNVPTAGASGALFGLFGALLLVLRRLGRNTSPITSLLITNLIMTFTVPGISIFGHLGGLVSGGAVGGGFAYAPTRRRTLVQILVAVVFTVAMLGLIVARTATLRP
jgi:membrane associated rhomboid family serine protease